MSGFTFFKFYEDAPSIVKADPSALGTMPASPFKYCEAMRTASSFGWYVFPPKEMHLYYDGVECYYHEDDRWNRVKSEALDEETSEKWNRIAPQDCQELEPPFLSELAVPGVVQIWSGYFLCSPEDWSTLIRTPSNYEIFSSMSVYEGLVETDRFNPLPLFVNLRLKKTDVEIHLSPNRPLFQIQPIHRSCYGDVLQTARTFEVSDESAEEPFPWEKLSTTVRHAKGNADEHTVGRYARATRRRTKEALDQ